MGRLFWIIGVIFGISIAIAVILFLVLRPPTLKEAVEKEALFPSGELEKIAGYKKSPLPGIPVQTSPTAQWALPLLKEPEFKPFFQQEEDKFSEIFLERFSALANPPISASQSAPDFFFSPQSTSTKKEEFVHSVPEATSTEIILSLTDEEFHFLYPDTFIASLMEGQNLFIKEYVPSYQPLSKIETDTQVRFIEEKIVAGLLSAGMITEEEAERFITTIRFTLPRLQLTELKNRKSSALNQFLMLFSISPQAPSKGLFFSSLIEKLYSMLFSEAQAKVCGYCSVMPECFQVGAPMPEAGINIWRAFCYCTGCYYGQGCLDFCEGMSAIWDPMTGICGCG